MRWRMERLQIHEVASITDDEGDQNTGCEYEKYAKNQKEPSSLVHQSCASARMCQIAEIELFQRI